MLLKTLMELEEFLLNKKVHMFYQKTHKIYQIRIMITNKETFFQLVTNMIHKAKLILKIKICNQIVNIQLCLVSNNTFYLKMHKIFQMLTMIINKEMLFLQDTNTTHKARLTFKIMLFHQIANIQLCSVNKRIAMFYQKTHKISQIQIMIINREIHYQLVTNMIHRAKHISKIKICNQIVSIQLCSMKKKTRRLTSINITINIITRMLKMNKKFKLVLNQKNLRLH